MYSIAKLASRVGRMGNPLPDPFPTFATNRVTFRRGATSMIAGQPGAFKSTLALNMLVAWASEGCSSLYFSADSDEFTVGKRLAGIITGEDSHQIERTMQNGKFERYTPEFASILRDVRFEYRILDVEGIADRVASFEHAFGAYPDCIFIDNLINYAEFATDWGAMIDFTKELDSLARECKSHIVILHHASEGFPRGVPLPSAAIQGKVTQIPRLVLTTAADGLALMVTCVKNTNGPQHPNAAHHMNFVVEQSMRVEDLDYAEMLKA